MDQMLNGVVPVSRLSPRQRSDVQVLLQTCNAYEGLDTPVNIAPHAGDEEAVNLLLFYREGALVGCCSIFQVREPEISGMVHPSMRQQGVGRALLAAAVAECRRRSPSALLICERGSASGQAFAAALGLTPCNSEHRMERGVHAEARPSGADARLEQVSSEHLETFAEVTAAAFDDDLEATRVWIRSMFAQPDQRLYLAFHDTQPVGALRVEAADARRFIYGLGVRPEWRHRAIGRRMIEQVIDIVRNEGAVTLALEVETTNVPAVALYRSCGFAITRTFDYFELPFGSLENAGVPSSIDRLEPVAPRAI